MDTFDLALLQEWELDELCGYKQDTCVLHRKDWEKRTEDIQPSENTFLNTYPLFSEPYKTSKGDELSSRVQSTLGNYDEMKHLLTERSNQSHLVGIPKSESVNTLVVKTENCFHQSNIERHYLLCNSVSITHKTKSIKVYSEATMNWQESEKASLGQNLKGKTDQRMAEPPSSDLWNCAHQNHAPKSPTSSTVMSPNDHSLSVLTSAMDKPLNLQLTQSKLNCNLELDLSNKEKTYNKSSHSIHNFPSSIGSKLNTVQQKPTAYVRPMDGQDQTPNESPKLKLSTEMNMVFPSFRGQSHKVASDRLLNNKIETSEGLSREEDNQQNNMGFISQKNGDLKVRSPTHYAAQISLLEDDLKLSSDEEDCHQPATEASGVQSESTISGDVQICSDRTSGISIKGSSSSSSETDTSSESDSESSSSESESSKPSACTSPEPQQTTTNKWQLDKWLNKVSSNKNSILRQATSNSGVSEIEQSCKEVSDGCLSNRNDNDDSISVRGDRTILGNDYKVVATVPVENSFSHLRPVYRKLTKRTEKTSSDDNHYCHKIDNTCQRLDISGNEIPDQPKNKLPCNSRGLHKEEPITAVFVCKSRQTHVTRSTLKSKAFRASQSRKDFLKQSSEHSTETYLRIPPVYKDIFPCPSDNNHKDCESSDNSRTNCYGALNKRNTSDIVPELEEQFYTLVPFGRNDSVCPVKGSDEIKSLWVRINLTLLSRIPQQNHKMNTSTGNTSTTHQNKCLLPATDNGFLTHRRKRKFEQEVSQVTKKNHVDKEDGLRFPLDSPDTSNSDSTNPDRFEMPTTVKGSSDLPFHPDESKLKYTSNGITSTNKADGILIPSYVSCKHHHRKEHQSHAQQESLPILSTVHNNNNNNVDQQPDNWSSDVNGHKNARKTKQLIDSTTPHNADYYMQEAKRMKHKADAMVNKFDKVLNYTEAALSFIECGNALELGPIQSKSPYTMYSETVELIRYALRLKSHSSHNTSAQDKKITALCYRCLALLYWRMFRLKRDHAVKYSKALIDYFKNSSKASRVPPQWDTNGKITGTPSPMSPCISQKNSVSSSSTCSTNTIISIPQRIHQMAANHVSITNSILHSYDYWEIADNLAKDNSEFFCELDTLLGPITFHSSMEHLVHYTRQGLSWIKQHSLHNSS